MAKTSIAIAGFFRTRAEGEEAEHALLYGGFTREEVSFLAGDTAGHQTPAVGPLEGVGAESEASRDAFIGGAVGLAAGVVAAIVPGLDALTAAGPLAGAIGGMGIGAAAGGIIGLLRDHGISQEEAQFFAEGVKRGGALVTVHDVDNNRAREARTIMERYGALDTEDISPE
jgi:hypothetical protein